MTDRRKKNYSPKVRLDAKSFNTETGKYSFAVDTTYMGTLTGQIEVFNEPKVLTSSYTGGTFKVIWELTLDGYSDKITVYYNETDYGTRMSGTLVKDSSNRGQAWINLAKVLSMGNTQDYELWVVENEQDPAIAMVNEVVWGAGQSDEPNAELPFI